MADLEKTVAIIFQGDDRVTRIARSIGTGLGDLTGKVEGLAQPFARLGEGVIAVDAALSAMVVGGMALAIRESGRFGDSFNEISTLIDQTGGDVDKFRVDLLEYTTDSRKNFDDINEAVYAAISAGTSYKDSLGLLSLTERLSIAGRAELKDTTVLLASSLNAYGEGVDRAERYSDVFFKTVKLGQTTLPELAQKMATVTGVAAGAGIPIETLASAVAALTASGLPTAQAVSALKEAIANIIKPSSTASDLAAELGLRFDATALKTKGFEAVLWDAYRATGGSTEQMARLFGSVEGLNAALILGADKVGRFKRAIAEMQNAAGATEAAYRKMAENFDLVNQQVANNVRVILVQVGDRLRDEYGEIAGDVVDILKVLGHEIDQGTFDPLFAVLEEYADAVSDLLRAIAQNLPDAMAAVDFEGLLAAVRDLGDEVGVLFEDADLTTPEGLAAAIQAVVDTLESLVRVTTGMVEYFEPVWDAIRESVDRFNDLDANSKKAFGNVLMAAEMVVRAGVYIAAALVAIKESGADIENVFNLVAGSIRYVWNTLQQVFDTVGQVILGYILTMISGLERVTGFIPGLGSVHEWAASARRGIEDYLSAVSSHKADQAREAVDGLAQAWQGLAAQGGEAERSARRVEAAVSSLPEDRATQIRITGEESAGRAVDRVKAVIDEKLPGALPVKVTPEADLGKAEEEKRKLDEKLAPAPVKVTPEIEMKRLEEQRERVESILKYRAEVDTAEIEAGAKTMEAVAESMGAAFKSTGDTLSNLFGMGTAGMNFIERRRLEDAIKDENRRREEYFKSQKELAESAIALNEKKASAMDRGDSVFKIQGDGLKPHLEAFMWEILEAIQVRANEEASEFLLGV